MKRLLLIAAVLGLIALAVKKSSQRREEWHGLSEAEAREKLEQRLPSRMPEDRREAMTDKIVGKMRERGVLEDDTTVDLGAADDGLDLTESEGASADEEAGSPV